MTELPTDIAREQFSGTNISDLQYIHVDDTDFNWLKKWNNSKLENFVCFHISNFTEDLFVALEYDSEMKVIMYNKIKKYKPSNGIIREGYKCQHMQIRFF